MHSEKNVNPEAIEVLNRIVEQNKIEEFRLFFFDISTKACIDQTLGITEEERNMLFLLFNLLNKL